MAGVGIRIEVDDADVTAALRRAVARISDLRPVMAAIGSRIEASTILRFERERGPDGTGWKRSHRAREESGQTLTDTARLRGSITHVLRGSGPDVEVLVGTNVEYGAIHQFGDKTRARVIRPKYRKALKFTAGDKTVFAKHVNHPGSKIPARPFLGLSGGDRREIRGIIERHLAKTVS